MALTQVSRGLLSTSIDDNGNATAITIDSSENVSITNGNLDVTGTVTADALDLGTATDAATVSTTASDYQLQLGAAQSTTGDIGRNISFGTGGTTTAAINSIDGGTGNTNALAFYTSVTGNLRQRLLLEDNGDISFYEDTGTTPKLFWDASAESLGIGTSSPTGAYSEPALHIHAAVNGAEIHLTDGATGATATDGLSVFQYGSDGYIWERESGNLRFGTAATERMRIASNGQVLVAKTEVNAQGSGTELRGTQIIIGKTASGTVNGIFFVHNTSYVGGLNYSNTATAVATSSDERLKENIADADDAGNKIDAMQVRKFDWKEDGSHQEYGFVAQELEPVFSHAVHTAEDDMQTKGVDYASLVPMLVKEIQSLRTRVQELENN